jgi:hypothetical protein
MKFVLIGDTNPSYSRRTLKVVGLQLLFDISLSQIPFPVKMIFSALFLHIYFPLSERCNIFHTDKVMYSEHYVFKEIPLYLEESV